MHIIVRGYSTTAPVVFASGDTIPQQLALARIECFQMASADILRSVMSKAAATLLSSS